MNFTKSSNPVFGNAVFSRLGNISDTGVMTVNGTMNKTGLMLLIVTFAALFSYNFV